jgi:bifunctional DNase/RNase
MVEVSVETLLVAMPPTPSVVVLRPIANKDDSTGEQQDIQQKSTDDAKTADIGAASSTASTVDSADSTKAADAKTAYAPNNSDTSDTSDKSSKSNQSANRSLLTNLGLGTRDVLPIWIGPSEAASIGIALEHHPQPRPMTHDLLANTIYALGANLERVVIDRVEGSTFYATVYINSNGRILNIDARPSDSIALAVRMRAPLFVDEDVMNAASHKYSSRQESVIEELEDSQEAMEEFHEFLESITPEDFSVSE